MGKTLIPIFSLLIFLHGCLPDPESGEVYLSLGRQAKGRLPLAPHVNEIHARPTMEMINSGAGTPLRFMILDKRTLNVHRLHVLTGEKIQVPWSGEIHPRAYVPDLIIRDGQAVHGPKGHVNPAAWIELKDERGEMIHEGWVFSRDTAQTARDHPLYDLTFLGPSEPEG